MSRNPKLNPSGYRDMTAFKAINNADRSERNSDAQKVFICSPYAGDVVINIEKALKYCRFAVDSGKLPIAPHIYFTRFMDDGNSKERELGISLGIRLLNNCKELWIFGTTISKGMRREIKAAKKRGIKIRNFSEECKEGT